MAATLPGNLGASLRYWFSRPKMGGRVRDAGYIMVDGSTTRIQLSLQPEPPVGAVGYALECGTGWAAYVWSTPLRCEVTGRGATPTLAVVDARVNLDRLEGDEDTIVSVPQRHLERELGRHDWWCSMSDSWATTEAGERHMREIILPLLGKIPEHESRALWSKYAPKEFPYPSGR